MNPFKSSQTLSPDASRTPAEQEAWETEAKRLNDLVVELTPPRRSPDKAAKDDTPAEVLAVLLAQQEAHLGGIAKPGRGFLPGTLVAPHGRERLKDLDPWKMLQVNAVAWHRDHPDTEFPVYLENRRAKRIWAKKNPFGASKVRIKNKDVIADGRP